MKPLRGYHESDEAKRMQQRLHDAGIPTLLTDTRIRVGMQTGFPYLLAAVIDEQYEDALALLADPQHPVRRPVSIAAYEQYMESAEHQAETRVRLLHILCWLVLPLLLLAGLLFWLWAAYGKY